MLHPWLKSALKTVLRVLFRVRVQGHVQAVAAERLLIVANHESFLDGLLLGLFLPVEPVFVVHTTVLERPLFRWVLRACEHLAVDPVSPMAMKRVVRLLEAGRPVMIFPEGRITDTGSLMKVYEGPAFVAARTGATVLPVHLDGPARSLFSRMSGRYPRRLLPQITLTIEPPTSLPMPEAPTARQRRRAAGEALRRLLQTMIFRAQPVQTLYSALVDAVSMYGRRYSLAEDMRQAEYRYGDLLKTTLALGRLVEGVTQPGETVGLLLPNLIATPCLMIGLGARGRIPAMLNYSAGPGAVRDACTAACIRSVVTSRAFVAQARLQGLLDALPDVQVHYLEDLRQRLDGRLKAQVLLGLLWPRRQALAHDPEAPAVVLFTSGSEGKPKGVVLSHRAILANIAQIRGIIDFSTGDKVLNALPVFHAFGLTAGALLPMLTGVPLLLYPSPLHYRVIPELAYDRNCTILFGTNTFLANYARHAHPYDFHRLRHVVAGAERLADSTRQVWMDKFGVRVLEGYGATETAPVLAVNTPMAYRAGSVGQLLPAIEAQVLPVAGIERGGRLHVRGPNLMSGYLRVDRPGVLEPPSSEAGPGWYDTGDIVDIDAEGFVHILGRVKRFAKVAGEMVSLENVERLATAACPEALHAATAVADAQRGEAIVLFTTAGDLGRDRLAETARALGMSELNVPRRIETVRELPLLGTGKVDHVQLRQMAGTLT